MARFQSSVHSATALVACLVFNGFLGSASAVEVASPDGKVVVTFELKDIGADHACPIYRVTYNGKTAIADSRLGLELDGASLNQDMSIAHEVRSQQDTTWTTAFAERSTIRDHYNQLTLDLTQTKTPHRVLQLTFRAYNEGAAFRYAVPEQEGLKDFIIKVENTQFAFTGDYATWAVYTAQGPYDEGQVTLSQLKPGVERPLTVRVANDLYASVTEAKLIDYARMKLRPVADQPHAVEAYLDAENDVYGMVAGAAPFSSPWRVVMLADSPGKLLEQNYIVLNLNDPCALQDTSWIKPGKVMRVMGMSTENGKLCVDNCVQAGMQYIEFDAGWYGNEYDDKSDARAVHVAPNRNSGPNPLDLPEVIRYADSKGIGVILYVNRQALERQLDAILPIYQKWGIKGVKFGFVNVGSQNWTRWLHDAIRKAAACKLMVDIHDEFRSTGFQRTYPNLMTVEGIHGNESFPIPLHDAIVPFTRFLTGPADYTFCYYTDRNKGTRAHQLAISTIFFSPFQFLFWYSSPSDYQGDLALDYWKYMPTVWDDTRVLKGEIGKYVSVARRKGQEWFIGSIYVDGRGQLDLPLSFLDPGRKYTATICCDPDPANPIQANVKVETLPVDSTTVLKADIPATGGHAVHIVPVSGQ